jgi:hypothetical protein
VRDDKTYSTVLRVEEQSGVISDCNMGGPKLWNEESSNVYVAQAGKVPERSSFEPTRRSSALS